jgi:hypothetical protein
MSLWGDLFGGQEMKTENLLSGQQQQAMGMMGTQANRLQELGNSQKAVDVRDTGFQSRLADYTKASDDVTDRAVGDVMHSNKIHSSANMLQRAKTRQGSNFGLADIQQQQMQQQLRDQERAQTQNEYMKRSYLNQGNQLRSNIMGINTVNNQIEDKPGIFNNIMGLAGTAGQLAKTFGG